MSPQFLLKTCPLCDADGLLDGIRVRWGREGGARGTGLVTYQKRTGTERSLSKRPHRGEAVRAHSEKTAACKPGEGSRQSPATRAPCPRTSSFRNCKKVNGDCLHHPVCGNVWIAA